MQTDLKIRRSSRILATAMVTLFLMILYINTEQRLSGSIHDSIVHNTTSKIPVVTSNTSYKTPWVSTKISHHMTNKKTVVSKNKSSKTPWVPARWRKPFVFRPQLERAARKSLFRKQIPVNNSFSDKNVYDIMNMKPIRFDSMYKNPCWTGTAGNGPLPDGNFHCLPYFYIIGVKKSGTTDIHSRLSWHPQVRSPRFKESQWLSRLRFGIDAFSLQNRQILEPLRKSIDVRSVGFFISLFDKTASLIRHQEVWTGAAPLFNKLITVEASPSVFHMHTAWQDLPGNVGLTEPRYTNFHYIKHLTPKAKIIVMFRDPVTRLYSDFLHTTNDSYGAQSPVVFHDHASVLVEAYKNCLQEFSVRSCAYNNTIKKDFIKKGIKLAESFNAGFYAVFMRDLYSVFDKNQIMPILMKDYTTAMNQTLVRVFSFLGLSRLTKDKMTKFLRKGVKNTNSRRKERAGNMMNSTRDMLYKFYEPFNREMAELMNDPRYLFNKVL